MTLRHLSSISAILSLIVGASPAIGADRQPVGASSELVEFHRQFEQPRLVTIRPSIHVAFGYGVSNFTFVETRNGIVVVDTGWFASEMTAALADLRKLTAKPIVALVYTHAHPDHTGGGGRLGELQNVPIFASQGFGGTEWEESGRQFMPQLVRAYSQLGLMLEDAGEDPVGGGVGRSPEIGERSYVAPTHFVESDETVDIDGVEFSFIPAAMDVKKGLMVWLPQQKILLAGDTVTGVFTILETPRYVPSRSPDLMARSFQVALDLRPDVLIPGHGRLLTDHEDVHEVLTVNRDLSNFLIDQVDRRIERGEGAEEIIHAITIPEPLASHPDLQPYYHRKDWMIRSLVTKRVGWYGNLLDLVTPDGIERAQKLVALVGPDRLETGFRDAMAAGDYRWAAAIAQWLRDAGTNAQARALVDEALVGIAAATDSANERSYILSYLAATDGRIDWSERLKSQLVEFAASQPARKLVDILRMRIDPDPLAGRREQLRLILTDSGDSFDLALQHGTLIFASQQASGRGRTIRMTRDELNRFFAEGRLWNELLVDRK